MLVLYLTLQRKNALNQADSYRLAGGTMAHAFQTPLSSFALGAEDLKNTLPFLIDSYEQALASKLDVEKLSKEQIESIKKIPEHFIHHTKQLRANIKISLEKIDIARCHQEYKICSLKVCLTRAVDDYPFLPKTRKSLCLTSLKDFSFNGCEDIFGLVLLELFENALKAIVSSQRGAITVSSSAKSRILIIEDSAGFLPKENLTRIFDKYFTTTKGGTGIGLYFCRSVMRDFGGDMTCAAQPGRYTKFILSFPQLKHPKEQI